MASIAVIIGTRPEIIRFSPIIRALESRNADFFVIHTGQHYDYSMDGQFFSELGLSPPYKNLNVGSASHATQTARVLEGCESVFKERKPSLVLVYGDTNSTMGATLAAAKLGIPVAHVEAGGRSYDMTMPEEINRVCVDHVSSLLFPPDKISETNLLNEGIPKERIFTYGNPLVGACMDALEVAKRSSRITERLGLDGKSYSVLTLHRADNVDNDDKLRALLKSVQSIGERIIFPAHPRTRKNMERLGMGKELTNFTITEPLGYMDFIRLVSSADTVLTDSGGVQVESNVLGVPCIVLRNITEWRWFVDIGMSFLAQPSNLQEIFRKVGLVERRRVLDKDDSAELIAEKCTDFAKRVDRI